MKSVWEMSKPVKNVCPVAFCSFLFLSHQRQKSQSIWRDVTCERKGSPDYPTAVC